MISILLLAFGVFMLKSVAVVNLKSCLLLENERQRSVAYTIRNQHILGTLLPEPPAIAIRRGSPDDRILLSLFPGKMIYHLSALVVGPGRGVRASCTPSRAVAP